MSHAEYVAWLLEIGTGWLGWAPDAVLDADMTDIERAYRGKLAMLKACFGAPEKRKPQPLRGVDHLDRVFG